MEMIAGLAHGFSVAALPANLLACFIGVLLGSLVGVLPGIGPNAGMALLIPLTFAMPPEAAIIMLAGIYYGSMYGGSTTAILLNVPGEAASVMTAVDGYQMAKKGRPGPALAIAAIGSFVAGTLGIVGIMLVGPGLAELALRFGPPEYFVLAAAGLVFLCGLSTNPFHIAFIMVGLGLAISTVGIDPITGTQRFTFGFTQLAQGIDLVPVIMGLYGIAEVLTMMEEGEQKARLTKVRFRDLVPSWLEAKMSFWPIMRGSVLGFLIGLVPGPATVVSSFLSYRVEKRLSRTPERFGHGAIEGVAGPESANNSATAGAMVPMFALGIAFSPATAMLLAALVIHGVQPGPMFMLNAPDVFWGVIASMYIGNLLLLVLNLPLVHVFVSVLKLPQNVLAAMVMILCLVGTYSINNSLLDIWIMVIAGALGYGLRKLKVDPSPLVIALVLGPMIEKSLRQTMFLANGEWGLILTRPICVGVVAALMLLFAGNALFKWRRRLPAGAALD
ncbi:tripartite tricarboxylate transporter permease [Xanthobacter tagetidis]|jgi:putative tricarboxylic transport membrane protein|uniref:Tripartite tricarboxylate transporter permease n=1 Tax=Xanthobacter tagetidis TaxID=60216 RepID=A0A3L6ZZS5_9HYPH|nr:tripartite tricarboxylate transporter permease [Xanthobacter tagetidis]MBB6307131.1 putative tricarboxylic transport membrane protein [Xanthobacter tagetidis]RLP73228.1 tripartite tricarboxylate transporter permease [Xanthobacter tagetidis]